MSNSAQAGDPVAYGDSHTCVEEFDPSEPIELSATGGGRWTTFHNDSHPRSSASWNSEEASAALSIMSSVLETTPTDRGELVIQQGELAGRRYSFEAVVCQNSTCDCQHVTLKCFTQMPEAGPTAPVYLEMDLERRQIANLEEEELKTNSTTRALANAVAAECGQEEWNQLRRILCGAKKE